MYIHCSKHHPTTHSKVSNSLIKLTMQNNFLQTHDDLGLLVSPDYYKRGLYHHPCKSIVLSGLGNRVSKYLVPCCGLNGWRMKQYKHAFTDNNAVMLKNALHQKQADVWLQNTVLINPKQNER